MLALTQKSQWVIVWIALTGLISVQQSFAIERPMIEANASDRERVLKLIDKYDWAAKSFESKKQKMAPLIEAHKESASKAFAAAPKFGKDRVHPHINWTMDGVNAGILYFMTGNEDYAQFAADRLNGYIQYLGVEGKEPIVSSDGRQRDYRDVLENLGLCYDYIYPFLKKEGTTVFDAATQKRIPFDDKKAQLVFTQIVECGFKTAERNSNLEIMVFDGMLYSALCIEDKTKRDGYVDQLIKGWPGKGKSGLLNMKKVLMENDGVWPESASYSGVGQTVPTYMELIDRLYPEVKIFAGFEDALNGVLNRLYYSYPNEEEMVGFGDSHRIKGPQRIPEAYTRVYRRAGFEMPMKRAFQQMKADREKYGYQPSDLWAMDPLEGYESQRAESQAVHLSYAGIAIQKNLACTDKKQNGLMYYSGGASYIHSHLSGLDLELYGAGHVMSGVGGAGAEGGRGAELFVSYYRNYAGHNTVVINGESVGGNKGWKGQDLNCMDTVKLQAMEPQPYELPISKVFTFSSQILNDTVNKATQQRIVSIIRTSDTTGYYLDLFRSRSNGENKFHDYIYHNMGDSLTLKSQAGNLLSLTPDKKVDKEFKTFKTKDWARFPSKPIENRGKLLLFPGWHLFNEVAYSAGISEPVVGRFDMTIGNQCYMHVAMPGGVKREYFSIAAPPILDGAGKYGKKPSRVLSIRQSGEAWDRPFMVVYEPSVNAEPTVQSVKNIMAGEKVVGVEVQSLIGGAAITDIIIAQDSADAKLSLPDRGIEFEGRFAIMRSERRAGADTVSLYIGEGSSLRCGKYELKGNGKKQGFKSFPGQ